GVVLRHARGPRALDAPVRRAPRGCQPLRRRELRSRPGHRVAPHVQVIAARWSCTERTARDPSPTAAATRFNEPLRTSPTAKTPGTDVSNGNGARGPKS